MLVIPNVTARFAVPNAPAMPQFELVAGQAIDVPEPLAAQLVELGKAVLVENEPEIDTDEKPKARGKKR